jgi:hypothetical protein
MPGLRSFPTIKTVHSYVIQGVGSGKCAHNKFQLDIYTDRLGGDYHNVAGGHWYGLSSS